jgi:hypothetical protein
MVAALELAEEATAAIAAPDQRAKMVAPVGVKQRQKLRAELKL